MTGFASVEKRLDITRQRYPAFPRDPAVLVRLIRHINSHLNNNANIALKPWGITYPEYSILMMLYGTESGAMSPTRLREATGEKSANVTRLTGQLFDKGLLERGAANTDRRKIKLTLTAKGEVLIESFLPAVSGLARTPNRQPRAERDVRTGAIAEEVSGPARATMMLQVANLLRAHGRALSSCPQP